jgi:hypothetical protein
MVKVRVVQGFTLGEKLYGSGTIAEIPEQDARDLIAANKAVLYVETPEEAKKAD